MEIQWVCKPFAELSNQELYAMLRLRNLVFVVEQQCLFQDIDDRDEPSVHLMGYNNNALAAYARIMPKGIAYEEFASIGRVVTAPEARGLGAGLQLMKKSIACLYSLYGEVPIKIGAQMYLKQFYESLGFAQCGDGYIEDGIDHIPMLKDATG